MPGHLPEVVFVRTGTDFNSHDFRHALLFSKTDGMECVHLTSEGRDQNGSPFREEWEHSENADEIADLLTGNEYLSLTRKEFEEEVLPNMTRYSPTLAKELQELINDDTDFCGDW